jgi:two-component system CheB/CheR fusion protein
MIVFSVHNLIQDPPFSKIDFVSCRNFLIYLNASIQKKIFSIFQFSLNQNGFLLLGSSESLGESIRDFMEIDKKHKIYTNKTKLKVLKPDSSTGKDNAIRMKMMAKNFPSEMTEIDSPKSKKRVIESIQDLLIQQYAPDAVIFNEKFDLVHTTGKTNQWLRLPIGEISINVLRMLPEELRLTFELAANKLINEKNSISLKNAEISKEMEGIYHSKYIDIHLKELYLNQSPQGNRL